MDIETRKEMLEKEKRKESQKRARDWKDNKDRVEIGFLDRGGPFFWNDRIGEVLHCQREL